MRWLFQVVGGKGGYINFNIDLEKDESITIFTGGKGGDGNVKFHYEVSPGGSGGYNGGQNGGTEKSPDTDTTAACSGGGGGGKTSIIKNSIEIASACGGSRRYWGKTWLL